MPFWAETSKREVSLRGRATTAARCCGSPTSARWSTTRPWCTVARPDRIDASRPRPRSARGRRLRRRSVRVAHLVRRALTDVGLVGAVKTSGAKGVHVFVPDRRRRVARGRRRCHPCASRRGPSDSIPTSRRRRSSKRTASGKVFVDSTRAGGATVVAAYSPRVRPGVPVSFPLELGRARRHRPRRLHRPHRARAPR